MLLFNFQNDSNACYLRTNVNQLKSHENQCCVRPYCARPRCTKCCLCPNIYQSKSNEINMKSYSYITTPNHYQSTSKLKLQKMIKCMSLTIILSSRLLFITIQKVATMGQVFVESESIQARNGNFYSSIHKTLPLYSQKLVGDQAGV